MLMFRVFEPIFEAGMCRSVKFTEQSQLWLPFLKQSSLDIRAKVVFVRQEEIIQAESPQQEVLKRTDPSENRDLHSLPHLERVFPQSISLGKTKTKVRLRSD